MYYTHRYNDSFKQTLRFKSSLKITWKKFIRIAMKCDYRLEMISTHFTVHECCRVGNANMYCNLSNEQFEQDKLVHN